jgi:hypothetical protein
VVPTSDKLKAMFLYIWRHIQHSIIDTTNGGVDKINGSSFLNAKSGILHGAKVLNEKFMLAAK